MAFTTKSSGFSLYTKAITLKKFVEASFGGGGGQVGGGLPHPISPLVKTETSNELFTVLMLKTSMLIEICPEILS